MSEAVTPLLELRDVAVEYAPRSRGAAPARAVDGVDLTISAGEVVALVGESGCGKTTLARAALGLQSLHSGTVLFDGEPIPTGREARQYRRQAQMVFQDPSAVLNPRQSIYEIVAEGLRVHGERDDEQQRVADALAQCGLRPPEQFFLRFPHELSGGQRQRVVIAGAMVLEPRLLVADEPVSSLDASVRGEILQLLLGLARDRGMGILVVTHDLGLAWNIADRVAVMYLGRIVEVGTTEELLGAPQHPYTQALLSVVPEHERLEQQILVGEAPDPSRIPTGCRFHPRCPLMQAGTAPSDRCTTEDPALTTTSHAVACHAR